MCIRDRLCGACVGMQLVSGLYDSFGIDGVEKEEFLEFAAVATIGDEMRIRDRLCCSIQPDGFT